jgi:hypothetical protein
MKTDKQIARKSTFWAAFERFETNIPNVHDEILQEGAMRRWR